MIRNTCARVALVGCAAAALLLVAVAGGGCGSREAAATATPTKTVRPPAVVQVIAPTATVTVAPTSPPTDTPAPTSSPTVTSSPTATETPVVRPANLNPLTGLVVSEPGVLARRPLMVVVNNDPPARSVHYGLAEAELVYEYIMEGRAVTRYTAVFLAHESERIGPVRSARLINFYLTPQFGGALVASGAGQDVRWWLKNMMPAPYLDIDLDDPSNNRYSFSLGTDYRTRMQTSTEGLRRWLQDWGVEQGAELTGFAFADAMPAGDPGMMASISFPAQVTWSYDATTGRYLRSLGSEAHRDAGSGQQLSAANVIIQTMSHEATDYKEDSLGTTSIRIISVGEGPVMILRDGVEIQGTWRADDTSMPAFIDSTGDPIPLKPGNSWIEVVGPGDVVTVS